MRLRRAAPPVVLLALLVAACGGPTQAAEAEQMWPVVEKVLGL